MQQDTSGFSNLHMLKSLWCNDVWHTVCNPHLRYSINPVHYSWGTHSSTKFSYIIQDKEIKERNSFLRTKCKHTGKACRFGKIQVPVSWRDGRFNFNYIHLRGKSCHKWDTTQVHTMVNLSCEMRTLVIIWNNEKSVPRQQACWLAHPDSCEAEIKESGNISGAENTWFFHQPPCCFSTSRLHPKSASQQRVVVKCQNVQQCGFSKAKSYLKQQYHWAKDAHESSANGGRWIR